MPPPPRSAGILVLPKDQGPARPPPAARRGAGVPPLPPHLCRRRRHSHHAHRRGEALLIAPLGICLTPAVTRPKFRRARPLREEPGARHAPDDTLFLAGWSHGPCLPVALGERQRHHHRP